VLVQERESEDLLSRGVEERGISAARAVLSASSMVLLKPMQILCGDDGNRNPASAVTLRHDSEASGVRFCQFGWLQGLRKLLKGNTFWLRGPDLN
jgi:hypothetical protein